MRSAPNPARAALAEQMAEYERKHGAVQTTPIIVREHPKAVFLATGIRNPVGKKTAPVRARVKF